MLTMLDFQVESPIQNSPYDEPTKWWRIVPGETPQLMEGRRPAASQWERIAATVLDSRPRVESFVKNSGLGFAIPYTLRGTAHDYLPDFIVRLDGGQRHLIVEIEGVTDEQTDAKKRAAQQWCEAVSGAKSFGCWDFLQIEARHAIPQQLDAAIQT